MVVPVLFFLAAYSVKQDQTPLRSSCDAEATTFGELAAGTPVEVRFAVADGSDCFKISATVNGKQLTGYVPASALKGVDRFNQERASAASADTIRALNPVAIKTTKTILRGGDPALVRASQLMEANQPSQALDVLEPAVKRYPKNPDVLLLAGLAAYRADRLNTALDYWKQSLALAPNPALEGAYNKVQREAAADHSGEKMYGMRITLRYEGNALPGETARSILSALDEEFNRISGQLGCSADERIVAIVQSRQAYLRTTGAAEWSGGQYDGRIHISWNDSNDVSPEMRRSLAHELVHACLANIPSGGAPWPAWLQEGLAQKLSGDTLPATATAQLRGLAEAHKIPKLEKLGQNWSRLSTDNARVAYALALAAADTLFENYSNYGIRNLVNNPDSLKQITADLDRKLGL